MYADTVSFTLPKHYLHSFKGGWKLNHILIETEIVCAMLAEMGNKRNGVLKKRKKIYNL